MEKTAPTRFPVHELIAQRWSPRAFSSRRVEPEVLGSLLEAARWAPSSFNEQPWSYVVANRDDDPDGHARLLSCLVPGNQAWAAAAPVLMLSVAKLAFDKNGKPNRHAWHDVGLATASLVLQAQALGLASHQMAGYDAARAREVLAIPDGHEPVAAIAIGHPGRISDLPANLAEQEAAPRIRKPLGEFVFGGKWGEPLGLPE